MENLQTLVSKPYYGSGVDVDNAGSIEEVMEQSGLNWEVE